MGLPQRSYRTVFDGGTYALVQNRCTPGCFFISTPYAARAGETCIDYTGTAPVVDYQRFDDVRSPVGLGGRLLICDNEAGLQVMSLGNLPQLDPVATITVADGPWQIAVAAGLAVVNNRNSTLQLLDLDRYVQRDPVVASSPLPNRMWNLRARGNRVYGIHGLFPPRGFFVLELDELGGLSEVGRWSGPEIMHSGITDDLAVLAEGVRVRFLEISNPGNPVQIGEVALFGGQKQIAIDGHFAYIFHSNGTTGNYITLVDFADPRAPSIVGTSPDLGFRAERLHAHKGIVYAAGGEAGLAICMMGRGRAGNKPTLQFKHLDTVSLPGWPYFADLQFKDDLAYVSSSDALDISDPTQPEMVGYLETGQHSFGLVECGEYLVSVTVDGLGLSLYPQCSAADEKPLRGRDLTRVKVKDNEREAGLQSVYPIPGNPSVTFKYDLGAATSGDISIYDLRGHRVYQTHLSTATGAVR